MYFSIGFYSIEILYTFCNLIIKNFIGIIEHFFLIYQLFLNITNKRNEMKIN